MNGFLIKKSFFDGWDNLIGMVLQNLGYMGLAVLFLLVFSMPQGLEPVMVLALIALAFLKSLYAAGVNGMAYSYARYERIGWAGFKRSVSTSMRHVVLDWLLTMLVVALFTVVMPFYVSYRNLVGFFITVILFWIGLGLVLATQLYWGLHFTMEGDRPTKTLKKCFIIMFDNMGKMVFLSLFTLVDIIISIATVGLIPGMGGIDLLHQDFVKLIMLKYDYLEKHPDADRKHLPWTDLLYDDRESIGPRSLKGMIFPWKD
ncbi:MAG: hypothetical protein SPL79_03875 [Sphaerochaetaceae bacterium]|nr:hypothetical protein [Spirochaetaceae bacterium]MDY6343419.1 hypothetical protein [Sphaerochaetaceae bacterium]